MGVLYTHTLTKEQTMSRVLVIVNNGMADVVNDPEVEVLVIDLDTVDTGVIITDTDIEGFEDLVPQWIKDQYINNEE